MNPVNPVPKPFLFSLVQEPWGCLSTLFPIHSRLLSNVLRDSQKGKFLTHTPTATRDTMLGTLHRGKKNGKNREFPLTDLINIALLAIRS